jgi:DNA-binding GntR family transcriptional regulator
MRVAACRQAFHFLKTHLVEDRSASRAEGEANLALATPLQTHIRNRLRERFSVGTDVGDRINEAEIAAELGISRTPVREVLTAMVAEGVLTYEPRRGFRILSLTAPVDTEGDDTPDLLDERVMRDMALGALTSVMSESALMERYGASHGPLQSTLRRLMRDRLVAPALGRGWVFTEVDPAALRHSYRFRQIVEPASILAEGYVVDVAAMESLDAEHADALAGLDAVPRRRLFDLDARFHELVARGAGIRYLVDVSEWQNNIRRISEYIGFIRLERIRASMEEHRGIMAALLKSEWHYAAALMRVHLQISADETFQHLEQDLDRVRDGRVTLNEDGEHAAASRSSTS